MKISTQTPVKPTNGSRGKHYNFGCYVSCTSRKRIVIQTCWANICSTSHTYLGSGYSGPFTPALPHPRVEGPMTTMWGTRCAVFDRQTAASWLELIHVSLGPSCGRRFYSGSKDSILRASNKVRRPCTQLSNYSSYEIRKRTKSDRDAIWTRVLFSTWCRITVTKITIVHVHTPPPLS